MPKYQLDTGLWHTNIQEFPNDKTAWETLRLLLPNKWATLKKHTPNVALPVNRAADEAAFNEKYERQSFEDQLSAFVPILFGGTDNAWGFESDSVPKLG